jgi:hypothetical protein
MPNGFRDPSGTSSREDPRNDRAGYDSTLDSHPLLFIAKTDDLGTTTMLSSSSTHHTASANSKDS